MFYSMLVKVKKILDCPFVKIILLVEWNIAVYLFKFFQERFRLALLSHQSYSYIMSKVYAHCFWITTRFILCLTNCQTYLIRKTWFSNWKHGLMFTTSVFICKVNEFSISITLMTTVDLAYYFLLLGWHSGWHSLNSKNQ